MTVAQNSLPHPGQLQRCHRSLQNQLFEPVKPSRLTEEVFIDRLGDNSPKEEDEPIAPYVREVDDGNVFVAGERTQR